ncbi:MAG: NosD domain-containing protein [Halovenus sp.]
MAVSGPGEWQDGFMSISAIRSPVVVQHSTFDGNRDGIYLHRSHGSVIRQNTFRDNRFGVHFMFTSDSLVADNVARGQEAAGITIMTSPTRNAVVDNDVRNAETGIIPGGSRSYIAGNVVANNERGMTTGATQSLYEQNVIYGNELGVRTGTIRPSNRVVRNDFVGNERHVRSGVGPLRIWTHDSVGNYWEGAFGQRDGARLDRSYTPTDGIDRRLHRVDGAVTLAASPARRALNAVRDTTPGMRSGEVVDTAPLSDPVNPGILAELEASDDQTVTTTSGRAGDSDD